ncbi:MAG: pilus assembly protein, partial [Candidatus Schmidhempelia sp.]|nr:pilus assembly protein [Candidatus Schmidhempelia sp.]
MKKISTIAFSYIKPFIKNEKGAFLILFALSVPTLLAFGSISIDMAEATNAKSRLAQAADEAALTIAAINNQNIGNGQQINKDIANNYFRYYARNQGLLTNINVTYDKEKRTYFVTSNYEAKTLLSSLIPGRENYIKVGNDRTSSGFVRKDIAIKSADIAFVLDFSSSTTCTINSDCNLWSSLSNASNLRINVLKTVMSRIINKYVDDKNILFTIVPFDLGVPIKPQQAINITHLPKNNEVGGEQIGCSVPYTLKSPYNRIDFSFWANKYLDFDFKYSYKYEQRFYNRTFYNMDYYRYLYFSRIVGPAMGLMTDSSLVANGICNFNNNGQVPNILYGQYSYSCELDKNQSIFRTANQEKIKQQYNYVIDLMNLMYDEDDTRSGDFSIANGGSVDFDATLKNIFNKQNIIEFYQPVAPNMLG